MDKITTEDFFNKGFEKTGDKKWVYNGDKPCVVDFYADWCAPCKALGTLLEDMSKNHTNIDFCKVNVEEEIELTELLDIRSIPLLIIVSKDTDPIILSGSISRDKLEAAFKTVSAEILI